MNSIILKINSFVDSNNSEVEEILENLLNKNNNTTNTTNDLFNPFENPIFYENDIETGNMFGDIYDDSSTTCNVSVDNNSSNDFNEFEWSENKENNNDFEWSENKENNDTNEESDYETDDSIETNNSDDLIEEEIEIEDIEIEHDDVELDNFIENNNMHNNPFLDIVKKEQKELKLPPINNQYRIEKLEKTISISKLLLGSLNNDKKTSIVKCTSPIEYKTYSKSLNPPSYYSKLYQKRTVRKIYNFRCPNCFLGFNTEWALNDHYIVEHNSFENTDPDYVIPTSENGEYKCPICAKNYITNGLLGEHFILEHNDYDELCTLDDKKSDNIGYPSLNLLQYIKMIKLFNNKEIKKLIYHEEDCNICYSKFKFKNNKYRHLKKSSDGYNSDMEVNLKSNKIKFIDDTYVNKSKKKYIFNKRKIWKEKRNITIKELLKEINSFRIREYIPLRLNCCNKLVCKSCFIEYLKHSNSIICPFCKKDHTQEKQKYITIVDLDDEIDIEKWRSWWNRNVNVFLDSIF